MNYQLAEDIHENCFEVSGKYTKGMDLSKVRSQLAEDIYEMLSDENIEDERY